MGWLIALTGKYCHLQVILQYEGRGNPGPLLPIPRHPANRCHSDCREEGSEPCAFPCSGDKKVFYRAGPFKGLVTGSLVREMKTVFFWSFITRHLLYSVKILIGIKLGITLFKGIDLQHKARQHPVNKRPACGFVDNRSPRYPSPTHQSELLQFSSTKSWRSETRYRSAFTHRCPDSWCAHELHACFISTLLTPDLVSHQRCGWNKWRESQPSPGFCVNVSRAMQSSCLRCSFLHLTRCFEPQINPRSGLRDRKNEIWLVCDESLR